MSFPHTKTPVKGSSGRKQRYTVPMRIGKYGQKEFYLTPELEAEFIRLYPITMNPVMMDWFGISFSTLQHFKRKLGLQKNRRVILKKHAAQVKQICKHNGYYDSLKGKAPSPQCHEAYKRKAAQGFSSIRSLKENNRRKYNSLMKRKSEARRAVWADERRRVRIGLSQKTRLNMPQFPFTPNQTNARYRALNWGYILGDRREDQGERYIIYYDKDTDRHPIFERNLSRYGFTLKELPTAPRKRRQKMEMEESLID